MLGRKIMELILNAQLLKCKKLCNDAKLPTKNDGDIGWDICCIKNEGFMYSATAWYYELEPGECHIFHTGLATAIPKGYAALLWDRSGMGAKKKIHRLAGVIDSSYRGEWMVCLVNHSNEIHHINAGDKIVQFIIQKEHEIVPHWVDDLNETERGEKGFGSSGR